MPDVTLINSYFLEVLTDRPDTQKSIIDTITLEVLGKTPLPLIIDQLALEILYLRRSETYIDEIALETVWNAPTTLLTGTATGTQTASLLRDTSKTMLTNQYRSMQIKITGGTGSGQIRTIVSNDTDSFTVTPNWSVTPVNGSSTYNILNVKNALVDKFGIEVLYL